MGLKVKHPHNSGFALLVFCKILCSERHKEVHENRVNGFSGKFFGLGKWFMLDPNVTSPNNSGSKVTIFFLILYNKGGQDLYANHISGFSRKNSSSGEMDHFGPEHGMFS